MANPTQRIHQTERAHQNTGQNLDDVNAVNVACVFHSICKGISIAFPSASPHFDTLQSPTYSHALLCALSNAAISTRVPHRASSYQSIQPHATSSQSRHGPDKHVGQDDRQSWSSCVRSPGWSIYPFSLVAPRHRERGDHQRLPNRS